MDFELMDAAQYRELDIEQLEARRAAILAELDGDSQFTVEELRNEAGLCAAEIASRNAAIELRNATVAELTGGAGFAIATSQREPEERCDDIYDTPEYRQAFMDYVRMGTAIPAQYREGTTTTTPTNQTTMSTDVGSVIPTTLLNRIIAEMDTYGNIWAKVTKTNVKGGVDIPTMDMKPTASWVGEGASTDQKLETEDAISFKYYGLECKIAQSLLVATVTLSAFEAKFVELATEAMIKALETSIIKGTGTGQPTGITKDSRITNVIELTLDELADWEAWHKKVKAKIKKAYRNGEFIMAQSSFDGYIDGMVDKNGQPVARVNYGINGEESYRFMGKTVETVEETLLPYFEDAANGDVVAIFGKLSDYMVNSNMQMTTTKWFDHDENKIKNKCLLIADGKVADPFGFVLIKLKVTTQATKPTA